MKYTVHVLKSKSCILSVLKMKLPKPDCGDQFPHALARIIRLNSRGFLLFMIEIVTCIFIAKHLHRLLSYHPSALV